VRAYVMIACVTQLYACEIVQVNNLSFETDEIEKVSIETVSAEMEDIEGGEYTRNWFSAGSHNGSNVASPWFTNNDTLGIFPASGDQIPFPLSEISGKTQTFVFYGKGWDLKKTMNYYSYFPFSRKNYKDSLNIRHVEYSFIGQELDSAHALRDPNTDMNFDNFPYWLQYTDPEIADASGNISFKYKHITAGFRAGLNFKNCYNTDSVFRKDTIVLIMSKLVFKNPIFTLKGTYNLQKLSTEYKSDGNTQLSPTEWCNCINEISKTNILNIKLDSIKVTKKNPTVDNFVYWFGFFPPTQFATANTFNIYIYDTDMNYYKMDADIATSTQMYGGYLLRKKTANLILAGKATPADINVDPWVNINEDINSNWNYK